MAGTFFAALVLAVSIGMALFGGVMPAGAAVSDMLSLVLAAVTSVAVASASALDS